MTITSIRDSLVSLAKYRLDEHKVSSLLHRIKVKVDPKDKLRDGLKKMIQFDEDDFKPLEEFIETLDFDDISKPKHGGRGADKGKRKPKGYVSYYQRSKQENYDNMMNHDGTPDSAWITPPNM
jgi:hypothetical protein